jgi:tetratricopeptide (TPR) repeat protein
VAVSWLQILGDVVYRAACLVALAIAPPFLDPEPGLPAQLALSAAVSAVLLAAAAYGALRLRAAHPGRGGLAAAALIVVALIAAVACAAVFRGARAPLGRGLLFVAVPLWGGLAVAAGAVAGRRVGARARLAASMVVAVAGIALVGGAAMRARSADARAALAMDLALHGDGAQAEKAAREALADDERSGRLHYALALALDRQGREAEALVEAQRAVDLGVGRDAALLVGAIAIAQGDLDRARRALDPFGGDRTDAPVQYDRALIADRTNDYNKAREGYLTALHADPTFANARYNLVVLTLRRGVVEEAKHHAKKFAEAFPQDPRNADLQRLIAAAPAPAPAPAK